MKTVQVKQNNEYLVFSNEYTKIVEEGDYYFLLHVSQAGAPSVVTSFKVTAFVPALEVSFNIRDLTQSFEHDVSFKVIKNDPSGLTGLSETVSLTCYDVDTASSCSVEGFDKSTLEFKKSIQPGNYIFTAVYTKETRKSEAKLKISVLGQSKSNILRVSIIPPVKSDLSAIDPSTDLVLQASVMEILSPNRVFKWTSNDLNLDSVQTSSKYIIIPKSHLVSGAEFNINLKVIDNDRSGDAIITFHVNAPPTIGEFSVNPLSGVALKYDFLISCGNGWYDSHLPLTYEFMVKRKEETIWKLLSEKTEAKSVLTSLPAGNLDIKVVVFDSLGSFSEATTSVIVTLPTVSQAIKSINVTQGHVSVSKLTSLLSVIDSVQTTNEEDKLKLKESGKSIVSKYFEEQDKKDTSLTATTEATAAKISVISSISSCVKSLPDDTVSLTIDKFYSTLQKASQSKYVTMSQDEIDISKKSASTLEEYVKGKSKRKVSSFSKQDLDKIESIYNALVTIQVKISVADMPAVRGKGVISQSYARIVSLSTLNGLKESVQENGKTFFTLSNQFSSLQKLSTFENVRLTLKTFAYSNYTTSNTTKPASKVIEFQMTDESNNDLSISSNTNIATLSIEKVPLSRLSVKEVKCFTLQGDSFVLCANITHSSAIPIFDHSTKVAANRHSNFLHLPFLKNKLDL